MTAVHGFDSEEIQILTYLKNLMRASKKQAKKHSRKNVFYLLK